MLFRSAGNFGNTDQRRVRDATQDGRSVACLKIVKELSIEAREIRIRGWFEVEKGLN